MAVTEEKAFLVRFAGRVYRAFYTVRSERQLMELSADDPVWDATVFCKNRDRQLDGGYRPQVHDQRADSPIVIASAEG